MHWCEDSDPSAADDRKLTFVYGPMAEVTVIMINATGSEIRLELSGADEPKVLAALKRVTRPRPRQSHVAAVRPNAGQLCTTSRGSAKSCSLCSLCGCWRPAVSKSGPEWGRHSGPARVPGSPCAVGYKIIFFSG